MDLKNGIVFTLDYIPVSEKLAIYEERRQGPLPNKKTHFPLVRGSGSRTGLNLLEGENVGNLLGIFSFLPEYLAYILGPSIS